MKRLRHNMACLLAGVSVALTSVSSCTLETSDNGDLDGYWHLTRVDTLATGGMLDLSEELRFWAVQKDIMNVVDRRNGGDMLLRFDKSGNTLRLYDPYVNDRMQDDIPLEDVEMLRPLGINALDESFAVERLSGDRMTLCSELLRLDFSKM